MDCKVVISGASINTIYDKITKAIKAECRTSATALAEEQRKNIYRRTARGIGENDSSMPPLTDPYARHKKKLGRSPIRNLRLTGQMIADMRSVGSKQDGESWVAVIDFRSGRSSQIVSYNQARAAWFGVSPGDKTKLERWIQGNFVPRLVKRLSGK